MNPFRRSLAALFILLIPVAASCNDANRPDKRNPDRPKEEGAPNRAAPLAAKVKALADFMTSDRPSLSEVLSLLGGSTKRAENDRYTEVAGRGFRAVVKMDGLGNDASVAEISIYPESEIGLRLKHLAAVLGEWDKGKVIRSKTSRVQFPNVSRSGGGATVFAELAFPPSNPDSPVLSLRIRRELPSRQGD